MEADILEAVKFDLGNPTIKTILRRFNRVAKESKRAFQNTRRGVVESAKLVVPSPKFSFLLRIVLQTSGVTLFGQLCFPLRNHCYSGSCCMENLLTDCGVQLFAAGIGGQGFRHFSLCCAKSNLCHQIGHLWIATMCDV